MKWEPIFFIYIFVITTTFEAEVNKIKRTDNLKCRQI